MFTAAEFKKIKDALGAEVAAKIQGLNNNAVPIVAVSSVTGDIVDNTDPSNPVVTQVQSDWSETDSNEASYIANKPEIYTKTVELTALQLQTLNSSPVELIPAPGAGKAIEVISAVANYTFNGQQGSTGTLYIQCSSLSVNSIFTQFFYNNLLNSTVNKIRSANERAASEIATNIVDNDSIVAATPSDDTNTTDSTLKIYLTYKIITL